jgi:hypothetical protein
MQGKTNPIVVTRVLHAELAFNGGVDQCTLGTEKCTMTICLLEHPSWVRLHFPVPVTRGPHLGERIHIHILNAQDSRIHHHQRKHCDAR